MHSPMLLAWAAALLVAGLFWWFGKPYAAWAFKYPSAWKWKISARITETEHVAIASRTSEFGANDFQPKALELVYNDST